MGQFRDNERGERQNDERDTCSGTVQERKIQRGRARESDKMIGVCI